MSLVRAAMPQLKKATTPTVGVAKVIVIKSQLGVDIFIPLLYNLVRNGMKQTKKSKSGESHGII